MQGAQRRKIPGTDLYAQVEGYVAVERGIYTAEGVRLGSARWYRSRISSRRRWVARVGGLAPREIDDVDTLAQAAQALLREHERQHANGHRYYDHDHGGEGT